MNDELRDNCPGLMSRPLPLGDVFQTDAVYPVLDRLIAGIVICILMVFPVMGFGCCPIPELLLNVIEYSLGTHLGYSTRSVPWP